MILMSITFVFFLTPFTLISLKKKKNTLNYFSNTQMITALLNSQSLPTVFHVSFPQISSDVSLLEAQEPRSPEPVFSSPYGTP